MQHVTIFPSNQTYPASPAAIVLGMRNYRTLTALLAALRSAQIGIGEYRRFTSVPPSQRKLTVTLAVLLLLGGPLAEGWWPMKRHGLVLQLERAYIVTLSVVLLVVGVVRAITLRPVKDD